MRLACFVVEELLHNATITHRQPDKLPVTFKSLLLSTQGQMAWHLSDSSQPGSNIYPPEVTAHKPFSQWELFPPSLFNNCAFVFVP